MKPKHTGIFFHVPVGFDPASIPALDGLHNEAAWFVSRVVGAQHKARHDGEAGAPFSRRTMKQFIHPTHVSTVRDALIAAGVVGCDESYTPAALAKDGRGESVRYWIGDQYLGRLRRVECMSQPLASKVRLHRFKIGHVHVPPEDLNTLNQHLLGWLRRLRIDAERAYRIIEQTKVRPRPSSGKRRRKRKLVVKKRRARKARTKLTTAQIEAMRVEFSRAANRMTVDKLAGDDEIEFERCP